MNVRTRGRRKTDNESRAPVVTRILANLLVITSAIVSTIYAYGFGQKSIDQHAEHRAAAQRIEVDRLNARVDELTKRHAR
jgi:hypothetical protein